jgi:hypothetical protein
MKTAKVADDRLSTRKVFLLSSARPGAAGRQSQYILGCSTVERHSGSCDCSRSANRVTLTVGRPVRSTPINGHSWCSSACRKGANKGHADNCIDGTVSARSNTTCGQYRRIRERNDKYILAHGCHDGFGSPLEFVAVLSCGFSQRIAESRGCIGACLRGSRWPTRFSRDNLL